MMNINQYPNAIATVQRQRARLETRIRKAQYSLNDYLTKVEIAIAFDGELKNDAQRKAKRLELLQAQEYILLRDALDEATNRQVKLEIELELLRNQFAVLKLELREAIANREAAA